MKRLLVVFVCVWVYYGISAQEDETWKCATDEVYREIIKNNPAVIVERQKLDAFVHDYISNNPKTDQVYIIPVVFHVVHNYGEENISYEQIVDAVEYINTDYRLQRSDTTQIHSAFKNIAADTHIEFRLARIDPWGECTIGVTRTVSDATYAGGEDAKEAAPTWPPDKYLNVWTVNTLGNGAAGWSYYPGTAPYGYDGIILLHDYVGPSGTSTGSHGSVLTHEAGHYLNLPHPWGSTNDPGLQSNCDMDDGIEDTPNTIGHTSCNVNAVSCESLDNVQNFMEYSYCYKMFTYGQSDVMRATLNSSVSDRNNLSSPENLIATGTNDGYIPQTCAPVADFNAPRTIGCTGFSVRYNDLSYNTDFIGQYNWIFEGGTPANSDEPEPYITYYQKGLFDAQLYVENSGGFDSKNIHDYIRIYDAGDGFPLPYTESFETTTFPLITGNTNNDFYLGKAGQRYWEQSNSGYTGKCIRIINRDNEKMVKNRIYLPNLYVENNDQPVQVTMRVAYGRSSEESTSDRLKFYVSSTCGDSLRLVQIISGITLTSTYVPSWSVYTPSEEDWKTHSITINSSLLKSNNLRLVIEAESGGGNAIYVDDVSFEFIQTNVDDEFADDGISVFPNPCVDELYIQNAGTGVVKIAITDYTGKTLSTGEFSGQQINAGSLIENLPSGIYFMRTETNAKVKTIKLIKN